MLGKMQFSCVVSVTLFAFILGSGLSVYSFAASDARQSFEENCAGCHTIGDGGTMGPDLKGILERRKKAWVVRYIQEPDVVQKTSDPIVAELRKAYGDSEMPNLGISREDAVALVDYIASFSAKAVAKAPSVATTPVVEATPSSVPALGDVARGRELFQGSVRFKNGAPSCLACHSVADSKGTPGGTLGPDLTLTGGRLGASALQQLLRTSPFPTMKPLYLPKPLTEDEQQDVAAYLVEVSGAGVKSPKYRGFLLIAAGLFVGFLVLINLIWARRLRGVRKALVNKGVK